MFLQGNAENCLRKETYPEFLLPDGSFRRTLAVDGQHFEEYVIQSTVYIFNDLCNLRFELPSCIGPQFLTIQKYFDELDTLVVSLVIDLAGPGNTTWTSPEDQNKDHSISEKYFKVNKGIPARRLYFYFLYSRTTFMFIP